MNNKVQSFFIFSRVNTCVVDTGCVKEQAQMATLATVLRALLADNVRRPSQLVSFPIQKGNPVETEAFVTWDTVKYPPLLIIIA